MGVGVGVGRIGGFYGEGGFGYVWVRGPEFRKEGGEGGEAGHWWGVVVEEVRDERGEESKEG